MAGLRETMKLRRRASVLTASEQLFRDQGYTQTSIEEIARAAEVSIGTLYKYFGSKSGILSELFKPLIEEGRTKGMAVLEDPPSRASDAVIALYEAYRFGQNWQGINLLQAFGINNPERDSRLDTIRNGYEEVVKGQLTTLLERFVAAGKFNATVEVGDAVDMLYMLLLDTFETYVGAGGAYAYEDLLGRMHRRIRFMFVGWE